MITTVECTPAPEIPNLTKQQKELIEDNIDRRAIEKRVVMKPQMPEMIYTLDEDETDQKNKKIT